MKSVQKYTLRNGLRIVCVPRRESPTTAVLILVGAGSEYETKRINGISHFLEHLVFKGTKHRPEPGMIAEELDRLGAEYNAFTGQEYTGYWAKASREKSWHILDIVADLYLHPIFRKDEIERERGVIIEEINLYEDMPMRKVQDVFLCLLYGDQPAGWDIAGEKEIIRKLQRRQIVAYREAHYLPNNTVVVMAGAFDPKKAREKVNELFGGLTPRARRRKPKTKERQEAPAVELRYKKSDQSHIVVGVRAFSLFDGRKYALRVLADVLGGGMSSRLFRRVREELGAAYYVRAEDDLALDHGYLAVAAGVDTTRLQKVVQVILEEFARLKRELVPKDELAKAKEHLTGKILTGLETSDALAGFYGMQELLLGSFLPPEKVVEKIRKVTAEEVRRLARAIFVERHLNLAGIGPVRNKEQLRKLLRLE